MKNKVTIYTALLLILACILILIAGGCQPSDVQPFKIGQIPEGEFDPAEWGKVYPIQFESWKRQEEPRPTGKSKYRRGWDKDKVVYDKLSEFPFAALLYHGWGFGIEYNEARSHHYAVIDQIEIDPSRTGPGGVCLACKTPYHKTLTDKHGMKFLTAKFKDALKMIPEKHREMGPACIDCHDPKDMGLTYNKDHLKRGLKMIGKKDLTRQEERILSCAQCHITYYVPRKPNKKVAGDVTLPWTGAKWGNISIEKIIDDLLTDYKREEWKQKVTGFNMPYIRHPEMELFTKSSVHFNAGLSCADCHMPYKRVGAYKVSDHNVMSPLKDDLRSCSQCHTEKATWLKKQVIKHQDRTASLMIRAGYTAATAAKLFEMLHKKQKQGVKFDMAKYKKVKDMYKRAFLRIVFIGAENSNGFHNPTEAGRILGDAIAMAGKVEGNLRQMLAEKGVKVPTHVKLDMRKYLNGRGKKKLNFQPRQELKDPYGTQEKLIPRSVMGF